MPILTVLLNDSWVAVRQSYRWRDCQGRRLKGTNGDCIVQWWMTFTNALYSTYALFSFSFVFSTVLPFKFLYVIRSICRVVYR